MGSESTASFALNKVVLDNFKSYAGRAVAEFNDRGIITVVGALHIAEPRADCPLPTEHG
jgi:hypothetical protein